MKINHKTVHNCKDCGVNTRLLGEYYHVHDDVWLQANPEHKGMLCLECLERRLGRELVSEDFSDAPVNDPTCHIWNRTSDVGNVWSAQSPRLAERMVRT